jgi:hypothetical protein
MADRSGRLWLLHGMAALLIADAAFAQNASGHNEAFQHTSAMAIYYSKGEYGESSDTHIRYLPFSHEIGRNSWRLKATVPGVEIRGPANVLINVGSVGGDGGEMASASGLGDVLLNLTYELPAWAENRPFVDFSVELKLPTADESKGLGTGKMDMAVQVDLYQMLGPASTLFGSLGYRYRRHSPFFDQLENSFSASVGISRQWQASLQIGMIYDYRQAVSAFTGDMRELLPYISWTPAPDWSLMFYTIKGFTEESADRAAGLQLSYRW